MATEYIGCTVFWGDFPRGAAVTAAERLDGVDLRVRIPDTGTARLAAAWDSTARGNCQREIYLLEDLSGRPGLLSAASTTARLVPTPPGHELVVQLRPVRQAQLGPKWSGLLLGRTAPPADLRGVDD